MNNQAIKRIAVPVLLMLPVLAQAQFIFTTNNNAITITGYTGTNGMVIIPSTTNGYPITSIGPPGFYNSSSLTSVTIPNSTTNIGDGVFGRDTHLTNITVDLANLVYSSLSGVLFDKAQTTLIQFPGGNGGSYTIPASVTSAM